MTDKPQMPKGDNRRQMIEVWHFWAKHKPEDIDNNPEYFEKVQGDLVDLNMGDVYSAVGSVFRVFLGDPTRTFHWAEFMVCGVQKTISETQVPKHRILWQRITDWRTVSVEALKGIRREVRWSVGKRVHEVVENGVVIFSTAEKDEANRVAGIAPVPAAA